MAREKFKRTIAPGEIKQGECIYGLDEMGLILSYYGKDSEIYKAMANGESVSELIEKQLKSHIELVRDEEKLLNMCKERETLVEQSRS